MLPDSRITVISYNIFQLPKLMGIWNLSPYSKQRFLKLREELGHLFNSNRGGDIILLQEAWSNELDFRNLGYHVLNLNREVHSGLVILSRWPFTENNFTRSFHHYNKHSFREGNRWPLRFRKGVLAAEIHHPRSKIWVANTHLVANYPDLDIDNNHLRELQFEELSSHMEFIKQRSPNFIVGGDLNCQVFDRDIFSGLVCGTFGKDESTYCAQNRLVDSEEGKLDHIFYSPAVKVLESSIFQKEDKVFIRPGLSVPISDHYAVIDQILIS